MHSWMADLLRCCHGWHGCSFCPDSQTKPVKQISATFKTDGGGDVPSHGVS